MRDYSKIDNYLDILRGDVYSQPDGDAHTAWATEYIRKVGHIFIESGSSSVLDIGCGTGFCQSIFQGIGVGGWTGTTMVESDVPKDKNVVVGDMMFLDFDDASFDIVFARHVLEHSPAPLLALMEWRRVSEQYLALVVPAPEYWGFGGKNHYSVMELPQIWWLLRRAGWQIVFEGELKTSNKVFMKYYMPEQENRHDVEFPGHPQVVEYQFVCEKVEEITE